jgi:hypothetical protein
VRGCSIQWIWTLALLSQGAFGGNKLELQQENHVLTIRLSNMDRIAGIQFTVNTRGGIALQSFGGSDRVAAAGFAAYQFLSDDSTLNVVMLAPVTASLPAGEGILGQISFVLNELSIAETLRVYLSRVVLCDAEAERLEVTSTQLEWNPRENMKADPSPFVLARNFPNPFNPSTTITYTLKKPVTVRLVIFDVSGRELSTLVNQYQAAGQYAVRWNAADNGGLKLASGVYFARLQVGEQIALQKMILTK